MHTNLHHEHLVFVGTQQYIVVIAEAMQCTHNGLGFNNALCMILNYLSEDGLELHEMKYAHLPETCCQMLTNDYGQWLSSKCALQCINLVVVVPFGTTTGVTLMSLISLANPTWIVPFIFP